MSVPARVVALAAAALLAVGGAAAALPARAEPSADAVTGVSAPEVFTGVRQSMSFSSSGLATTFLDLPIGTYSIAAKAVVVTTGTAAAEVRCKLNFFLLAGADSDLGEASVTPTARRQTFALHVAQILNSPAPVLLSCAVLVGGNVTLSNVRIVATRVADPNHLHVSPLP